MSEIIDKTREQYKNIVESFDDVISKTEYYCEKNKDNDDANIQDKIKVLNYKLSDVKESMNNIMNAFEDIKCELMMDGNNLNEEEEKKVNEYISTKRMWDAFLPYMLAYKMMTDDEYIEEENSDDEIGDTIRNGMISVNN